MFEMSERSELASKSPSKRKHQKASKTITVKTTVNPSNVKLSVKGTSAFLTCVEEIHAATTSEDQNNNNAIKKFTATNIFRKVNGQWYLSHHHASSASVSSNSSYENSSGGLLQL